MLVWLVLPECARIALLGYLGGPGSVPWLLTCAEGLCLAQAVRLERARLRTILRPLWAHAWVWPLVWNPAQAEVAWSTRWTSDLYGEALARWRLAWQDEVSDDFLTFASGFRGFFELLGQACDEEPRVVQAIRLLERGDWEARYFASSSRRRNSGLLLVFSIGLFQGSLFVSDPEEDSASESS